jgi:CubicO group peptidase (beta-lactamase class C family)
MKRILSFIIIGFLISCSFGVQGKLFENKSDFSIDNNIFDTIIDFKITTLMRLFKLPSFSAFVIDGDEIIWANSYGYYDLENNKKATDSTIYNLGSTTKTITGTALMQLWEKGLFDLDEDVNNYLPFSLRNPYFPDDSITFRMLLSHSSSINPDSIEYYWLNFSADPPFSFYPHPWLEEFLVPGGKWYNPQCWSNIYRPGENNVYVNANFDIIAYLVELISGESFIDFCKQNIFIPLEMYNTSFSLSELDINNVAIPYHYHNGEYLQINELSYLLGSYTPTYKYWRVRMYPVGGLYSTVSDFSHFFIAHMNGGVWNDIRILEEETVEEMHRIQSPGIADQGIQYYGLAWITFDDPYCFNLTISGHSGDIYGVSTMMMYVPSENIGVIYFANGDRINENNPILGQLSMIFFLQSLFKIGGYNIFSHIDLGSI